MIFDCDLSGAEWTATAYLSGDPNMLAVAKSGKSPHILTATKMFGVTEEVALRDYKLTDSLIAPEEIASVRAAKIPELANVRFLPRTSSMRNASKRANFGLNYREGYKTYALRNEMDEREAKQHVELYHAAYPGLRKRWYLSIDDQIRRTRTMSNCFGRKCYFMGAIDDEAFRAATSFVPQSTIVDITDQAMPKIMDDDSTEFRPCMLQAQVHDALYLDYVSRDFSAMAACLHRIVNDYMSPWLEYGEGLRLKVTAKGGLDWDHLHEVDNAALAEGGTRLADELRRIDDKARSAETLLPSS